MKIAKPTSSKKRLIIYALLAFVLLSGSYVTYALTHNNTSNSPAEEKQETNKEVINNNPPTDDQVTQGQDIKKQSLDQSTSQDTDQEILMTLVSNNKNETSVQLRTLIDKNVSDATCTLSVTQSDKSYTDTVAVQNMPSTSTCKGFDIPLSRLSPGTWTGTIKVQNNSGSVTQINLSFSV
jgi:hypothetical protein